MAPPEDPLEPLGKPLACGLRSLLGSMRTLALAPILMLTAGSAACGLTSDGQIGEQGLVRFSLVVDFIDNASIESNIATNRTVFVALQHPKEGFLDDETYTELRLAVERDDGEVVESLFPLGFAQYGVVFEEPGVYRLVAMEGARRVDELRVVVEDVSELTLSRRVAVTTSYRDMNGDSCTKLEEVDGIENVVLHRNQSLEMFVVPTNESKEDLIGFLALTGTGPDSVQLHSPLVGQGRRANSLYVTPAGQMADTIDLVIEDVDAGATLAVAIAASNEDQVISCQN